MRHRLSPRQLICLLSRQRLLSTGASARTTASRCTHLVPLIRLVVASPLTSCPPLVMPAPLVHRRICASCRLSSCQHLPSTGASASLHVNASRPSALPHVPSPLVTLLSCLSSNWLSHCLLPFVLPMPPASASTSCCHCISLRPSLDFDRSGHRRPASCHANTSRLPAPLPLFTSMPHIHQRFRTCHCLLSHSSCASPPAGCCVAS